MHAYTINASIQVVPIVQDRHPYEWVDEAIALIQQYDLPYEIGPFATVVEGPYDKVMQLIHDLNEHLQARQCPEWILNVQLQMRCDGPITGAEKTAKFQ